MRAVLGVQPDTRRTRATAAAFGQLRLKIRKLTADDVQVDRRGRSVYTDRGDTAFQQVAQLDDLLADVS